jgi:hypothetical protein
LVALLAGPWRSSGRLLRSATVAMLIEHPLKRAASPSSGGPVEDAFGALRETIWCVIVVSLSGASVVCV